MSSSNYLKSSGYCALTMALLMAVATPALAQTQSADQADSTRAEGDDTKPEFTPDFWPE